MLFRSITTAQVFGRKPPVLVSAETVAAMRPGSVIVDMAAETGGNVEGSVAGQTVQVGGVTIIGDGNWSNFVPRDASQMYSHNVTAFLRNAIAGDKLRPEADDQILSETLVGRDGKLVHARLLELLSAGTSK